MRYLKSATTLDVSEKYICYFPMKNGKHAIKQSGGIMPDVVVNVGSPEELMPLIRKLLRASLDEGRRASLAA